MVAHQVDFNALAARVVDALRAQFPHDTIVTDQGYLGRVHVKIVSAQFDGMDEASRQDVVWTILREALKEDAQDVAFVLTYGTDDL